jgi:hypothetical protein
VNARALHRLLVPIAAALALAACGEQPQTAQAERGKKPDAKAYEGVSTGMYTASGWKAGDKDSWEAQMKARAQRGQNEYARAAVADAKAP